MAKVTAPNLSMSSSGQVGKTLVNGSWRGVNYVRQYVTPANPNTTEQQLTRTAFAWINAVWKTLNAAVQAAWTLYAKGQSFTDRNAILSMNVKGLRTASTLGGVIMSPGAKGGLAAGAIAVAGGSGKLDVTLTAPDLPTGWTITAAHAVAILQQDVQSDTTDTTTYYATDATTPYVPSITVPAGTYQVFGFFAFTKADGSAAYGPSITTTGTATA